MDNFMRAVHRIDANILHPLLPIKFYPKYSTVKLLNWQFVKYTTPSLVILFFPAYK